MYDLIIIGGGISAAAAAIAAGKRNKKVLIIDKNEKLCKKIYATGNGRCNITNENIIYEKHYNSGNSQYINFLKSCIGTTPYKDVINFLDEIGIATKAINGYVYPMSLQASAFVWAILDKIKEYDIEIELKTCVRDIKKIKNGFFVYTDLKELAAKKILLACGGASYKSLGGSDSGYTLAAKLGHNIVRIHPALCGLVCNELDEALCGVRAACKATLYTEDACIIASETGELQINNKLLSGINIFNLSSKCGKRLLEKNKCYIALDFMHSIEAPEIEKLIKGCPYRNIHGALNSLINDKLALSILNRLGIDRKNKVSCLDDETIKKIIDQIKNYRVLIDGLKDFENAQVTAGGVDIEEIDTDLCSKLVEDLYFAGEIIDIDGVCGGYNITFAILSGLKVGNKI